MGGLGLQVTSQALLYFVIKIDQDDNKNKSQTGNQSGGNEQQEMAEARAGVFPVSTPAATPRFCSFRQDPSTVSNWQWTVTLPANFKTIRILFPALQANPRMVAKRSGGKLSYNPAGLFLVRIPHYPDFWIDHG
jgi:hypothetical protein